MNSIVVGDIVLNEIFPKFVAPLKISMVAICSGQF
jgi:hypothetical protein